MSSATRLPAVGGRVRRSRLVAAIAVVAAVALLTTPVALGRGRPAGRGLTASTLRARRGGALDAAVRAGISKWRLRAVIVRATVGGRVVYSKAYGQSMTGQPATTAMHFRNGAVAFTYLSTVLLDLVDRRTVSLSDTVSRWLPALPGAKQITLRMLANMTAGYADYVYQPQVSAEIYRDPFQQFTTNQLIRIGTSKPAAFAPGTNWGYSHTDYAVLARILEIVTHKPLARLIRDDVLRPGGLTQTRSFTTAAIPAPVLHTFTSERRQVLGIRPKTPFYEESTHWNPSWTSATGSVETSTITDLTKTADLLGSGRLLSPASHRAQITPALTGFGHTSPTCPACAPNTVKRSYGLGVILRRDWITTTKQFAGSDATIADLPAQKIAIAVEATYRPAAFDADGNHADASLPLVTQLARILAPASPIG